MIDIISGFFQTLLELASNGLTKLVEAIAGVFTGAGE